MSSTLADENRLNYSNLDVYAHADLHIGDNGLDIFKLHGGIWSGPNYKCNELQCEESNF